MLDKNGKDIVTEVIEDAKKQADQAEANATIFGRMFNVYARHCIIIRYDYRLVATEVVVSLAVLLLCIVVYLAADIEVKADPTVAVKSAFLTTQVIALSVTALIAIVYNLIVKTKEVLIVMLKLLVAISIIVLASSIFYKIKMDKTYDKNYYHSYFKTEAYKEYGEVDTYEEFEELWKSYYPDDPMWYEVKLIENSPKSNSKFRFLIVDKYYVIAADLNRPFREEAWFRDDSAIELCKLLLGPIRQSMEMVRNGTYNDFVEANRSKFSFLFSYTSSNTLIIRSCSININSNLIPTVFPCNSSISC